MTKKQILRDLDRLRAEIDKPEPDLRDVMDKLEAIERRLASVETTRVVERVVERYRPYPYQPYQPYWTPNTIYSSFVSATDTGYVLNA